MKRQTASAVDSRLAKALAHPLRVQLLAALNEGVASPNELSKKLDEPLTNVSYHVRMLHDLGCIELVETEPRRGALEHYYRAIVRTQATTASECERRSQWRQARMIAS